MTDDVTPLPADAPLPLEPPPMPEPPPPPRVGDPYWNWGPSTKFMVGGEYNVGT